MRLEVIRGVLRAGLRQFIGCAHYPAMDHGERYLGMKLDSKSAAAVLEGLVLKDGTLRQGNGAVGQRKPLAVPVIDVARPGSQRRGLLASYNGFIAGFDMTRVMGEDLTSEMLREHLRAKANAENGFSLGKRNSDPVGFVLDVAVRIVRAHRAAENDSAGMPGHRSRERIAKARPPNVERDTFRSQILPDGPRLGLMSM